MTYVRSITIFLFLMILFALTMPAMAAEDTDQASPSATPAAQSPSTEDLKLSRFPAVLGHNLTSNLFTRGNLIPFLIGSGAALAIAPADQEITRALRDHAPGYGNAGDIIGEVLPAAFAGGAFFASRFTKSDHFRSFGYTTAQAFSTNWILTQGIKLSTHRMRPDGTASNSFPSGHASTSFAISTVVMRYYGKKWGIPLYALSGLISVSRIERGTHWPSDIVAGAALGYIAGRTAIHGTERELARKKISSLMIVPVAGHDLRGISVIIRY